MCGTMRHQPETKMPSENFVRKPEHTSANNRGEIKNHKTAQRDNRAGAQSEQ